MSGTGAPVPPEPAGTFSINEKNSMFGITQSATWAPFGQRSGGRWMIGEYGNGPYGAGFIAHDPRWREACSPLIPMSGANGGRGVGGGGIGIRGNALHPASFASPTLPTASRGEGSPPDTSQT